MFDQNSFLSMTFNDALDSKRTPIPVGEYTGQIGTGDKDLAITQDVSKDGKPWARVDVNITVADPSGSIQALTGRNPVVTRMGIMLDLDVSGKFDTSAGKNIRIGKLFTACGWQTNDKGQLAPGWSFGWLKGKALKVSIGHTPNPNDASTPYEEVKQVTKV